MSHSKLQSISDFASLAKISKNYPKPKQEFVTKVLASVFPENFQESKLAMDYYCTQVKIDPNLTLIDGNDIMSKCQSIIYELINPDLSCKGNAFEKAAHKLSTHAKIKNIFREVKLSKHELLYFSFEVKDSLGFMLFNYHGREMLVYSPQGKSNFLRCFQRIMAYYYKSQNGQTIRQNCFVDKQFQAYGCDVHANLSFAKFFAHSLAHVYFQSNGIMSIKQTDIKCHEEFLVFKSQVNKDKTKLIDHFFSKSTQDELFDCSKVKLKSIFTSYQDQTFDPFLAQPESLITCLTLNVNNDSKTLLPVVSLESQNSQGTSKGTSGTLRDTEASGKTTDSKDDLKNSKVRKADFFNQQTKNPKPVVKRKVIEKLLRFSSLSNVLRSLGNGKINVGFSKLEEILKEYPTLVELWIHRCKLNKSAFITNNNYKSQFFKLMKKLGIDPVDKNLLKSKRRNRWNKLSQQEGLELASKFNISLKDNKAKRVVPVIPGPSAGGQEDRALVPAPSAGGQEDRALVPAQQPVERAIAPGSREAGERATASRRASTARVNAVVSRTSKDTAPTRAPNNLKELTGNKIGKIAIAKFSGKIPKRISVPARQKDGNSNRPNRPVVAGRPSGAQLGTTKSPGKLSRTIPGRGLQSGQPDKQRGERQRRERRHSGLVGTTGQQEPRVKSIKESQSQPVKDNKTPAPLCARVARRNTGATTLHQDKPNILGVNHYQNQDQLFTPDRPSQAPAKVTSPSKIPSLHSIKRLPADMKCSSLPPTMKSLLDDKPYDVTLEEMLKDDTDLHNPVKKDVMLSSAGQTLPEPARHLPSSVNTTSVPEVPLPANDLTPTDVDLHLLDFELPLLSNKLF